MPKRRKWSAPERDVKRWICHRFNLRNSGGHGQAKDSEVCAWIASKTGEPVPARIDRRAYMVNFWVTHVRNSPRTPVAEAIGAARKTDFYRSREWQEVRYKALVLHGGRCQCCGATAQHGKVIHVDHIRPRSKFPELQLELTNLQVLCEDCNLGKGARDQTDWRPIAVEICDEAKEHMRSILN